MNRVSSDWENGWISLAFFLCSTRRYTTKLTARRKAGIAAKRSSDAEMRRFRNSSPAEPRKTALNRVRSRTVVTGWYCWFIMYLSRMPATAPIMYPSTLKTNHISMGLNWAFNTVVYKKAVMRGMRGWCFLKIIRKKGINIFLSF